MEVITKNAKETFELGQKIGSGLKGGEVLALTGDLGAGKTTFIQGLAKGLQIDSKIVSPTFILMRSYKGKLDLYHLDLYRLEEKIEDEVENLGLTDLWLNPQNVVAIEWSEKIKDILPKSVIKIKIDNLDENTRKFTIK